MVDNVVNFCYSMKPLHQIKETCSKDFLSPDFKLYSKTILHAAQTTDGRLRKNKN